MVGSTRPSAASRSHAGAPLNLRDVWIETADIDRLLQSNRDPRRSILDGTYFLNEVRRRLAEIDRPPSSNGRRGTPVEMFLATTILHGVQVTDRNDLQFSDKRREAYFSFRHLAQAPTFSDLKVAGCVDRLAEATRSSAAYPAAFKPLELEPDRFAGLLRLPAAQEIPKELRLFDGGIVNNIPVHPSSGPRRRPRRTNPSDVGSSSCTRAPPTPSPPPSAPPTGGRPSQPCCRISSAGGEPRRC